MFKFESDEQANLVRDGEQGEREAMQTEPSPDSYIRRSRLCHRLNQRGCYLAEVIEIRKLQIRVVSCEIDAAGGRHSRADTAVVFIGMSLLQRVCGEASRET